jgi:hypothetical protein
MLFIHPISTGTRERGLWLSVAPARALRGATGRGEAAQHPQRLISRAGGQVHVTAVKYALMISLVAFLNRLVSELLADPRVASKVALLGLLGL